MPTAEVDHYEVFDPFTGFTFHRTRSLTVAAIIAGDPKLGLDYIGVDANGKDLHDRSLYQ